MLPWDEKDTETSTADTSSSDDDSDEPYVDHDNSIEASYGENYRTVRVDDKMT